MKRKIFTVVLCMAVMFFALAGCGDLNLEEFTQNSNSKENYAKDIETVLNMSTYLESSEDDIDEMLKQVKKATVYTPEGIVIKNSFVKVLKLCKEGIELTENITESNYEKTLGRLLELEEEIGEIMDQKIEEQLDALFLTAQNAGVEAEDLQSLGLDF